MYKRQSIKVTMQARITWSTVRCFVANDQNKKYRPRVNVPGGWGRFFVVEMMMVDKMMTHLVFNLDEECLHALVHTSHPHQSSKATHIVNVPGLGLDGLGWL